MTTREEDLVTLLDVCDVVAWRLSYSDGDRHYSYGQALFDAHDMAHVLTGGDAIRAQWPAFAAVLMEQDRWDPPSFPDVAERAHDLLARLRKDWGKKHGK